MTPERWQQVKEVLDPVLVLKPGERAAFLDRACATDSSLRRDVEELLNADNEAGTEFLNEPQPLQLTLAPESEGDSWELADAWLGRRVGSYKVVEQIGVGGMGEVYRAFRADDQYRKEVALKVVRSGQDSGFVISRFKNERQILASLDHPNIARLHDGGTTPENTPYFVMELIEGQPIDRYCSQRELTVTQRLKLFLQVCSAVQYAHQRLIIHRDLKPSNILVTSDGTPKLLDFGIAKILDAEAVTGQIESTLTIFRALTPGYASPEQVRGEAITTASDVYSLGIVLFELLTGQHPYRKPNSTPQEIARAVCEVEVKKPSTAAHRLETRSSLDLGDSDGFRAVGRHPDHTAEQLSKRLRGDLDTIVLMALRKEPQRRYASVEQFAEDIRRHLENLPVLARKDTMGYRTSKFVARHRAGVAGAVIVAITILAGLAVTLHEARIARSQQARAERRFNDVRKLANSLIFEIHDSIETMPGATTTRKLLLERALEYLDSLASESSGDISLQRELAAAYLRIGSLQGSTLDASLGQTDAALLSTKKAVVIREAVARTNPNNVADQLSLAIARQSLARMLDSASQPGARQQAEEALKITEPLLKLSNPDLEVRVEAAHEYELLSDIQGGEGDQTGSVESMKKSLAMMQALLKGNPQDRKLQRGTGVDYVKVANALVDLGARSEALQFYPPGLEIFESLAKDPNDARARRELALATVFHGNTMLMNGDAAAALTAHQRTIALIEPAAKIDPQNATLQLDLAGAYVTLGRIDVYMGKYAKGQQWLRRGIQLYDAVLARNHSDQQALHFGGTAEIWVAEALARTGKTQSSLEVYRNGIKQVESLSDPDPDARSEVATGYVRLGQALAKLGRKEDAASAYRKALDLSEPPTKAKPPNTAALYAAADAYFAMGELSRMEASGSPATAMRSRRSWNEAHDWYAKSADAWRKISNPGVVTPSALPCGNPAMVARAITQCDAALAKLRSASNR
jgi:serine/threonine protein kinase